MTARLTPTSSLRSELPNGFYLGNVVPGAGHLLGGSLADKDGGSKPTVRPTGDDIFVSAALLRQAKKDGTLGDLISGLTTDAKDIPALPVTDEVRNEAETLEHLTAKQFNSLTPENQGKWQEIAPARNQFHFSEMDGLLDFAKENGQRVRGHCLLWHNQNPQWLRDMFEEGAATDEELRAVLVQHINHVVGRYKGHIAQWDVANEIFNEDGSVRVGNPWIDRFGLEIIAEALRLAHQADPNCQLYLNDYNVESINAKSDAYYELSKELLAAGVPLHGFGIQGHLALQYGYPNDMRENMARFTALGLGVEITELDIRIFVDENDEARIPEDLDTQAEWYARVISDALAVPGVTGVTIWGVADSYSWIPSLFKGEGAALLFDDNLAPKQAYAAVSGALGAPAGG
ncbi:MAG: endo-1,4-beta-xylanase [Cellulomonadaceae bacterium]|nr:endo-1,4-beta-xylanase [Cellulomonadaceae bacterium]